MIARNTTELQFIEKFNHKNKIGLNNVYTYMPTWFYYEPQDKQKTLGEFIK